MSVESILKAKGAHVETTRPDTTLYTVLWDLKLEHRLDELEQEANIFRENLIARH